MEELAKLSQLLFKTNYFSVVWLYARMCSAGAMNLICFCLTSKPYLFGPWLAGWRDGWLVVSRRHLDKCYYNCG